MRMKLFNYSRSLVLSISLLCCCSCKDLTTINRSPNELEAGQINMKYVLTSALAHTANYYIREYTYGYTSDHGITEAMQYMQRDYIGYEINSFVWKPLAYSAYKVFQDTETLLVNSEKEPNAENQKFYKAVALILRGLWYGFYTSAWGDIPYSEAMKGDEQLFKPGYDPQKQVFLGIIGELKQANELLKGLSTLPTIGSADIVYAGNSLKWRKFANALRMRYYLRLSAKSNELKGDGLDIVEDFKQLLSNTGDYPLPEDNSDNAAISHVGTDAFNAWAGGILNFSNRSQFYRRKPCATIIDYLKLTSDPRLTTWFNPVSVQIRTDTKGARYEKGTDGFVKRYVEALGPDMDTSLYVGLKPSLPDPNAYNAGATANYSLIRSLDASIYVEQGANPHVSYLADKYAADSHPLVRCVLMSYSEVNFLRAEAALLGWSGEDGAAYYNKGIESSLDQYDLREGVPGVYNVVSHQVEDFRRADFLHQKRTSYQDASDGQRLEMLMTQKWLALWMTPEYWFDWRRTGLPDFGRNVIEGSNGSRIPVRLIYGTNEYILNEDHVRAGVTGLAPAEDTQWAKPWLLQGGDKPW